MDFYKKNMIYMVLNLSNALPFQKLMNSTEDEYEDLDYDVEEEIEN
jgi:hypothetical protein